MLKRIRYNSPVVLTFVIASFLVLVLNFLTQGLSNSLFFSVYSTGAYFDPLMIVRLFGYVLGHANLEHYISNMTFILLIGPMLEEKYGSKNLLTLMLITTVVTGIVHMLFFKGALLGASGIVFAMIMLSSIVYCRKDEIPLTFLIMAVIYLGGQVIDGLFVYDSVSQFGHLAGGLIGSAYGFSVNSNR